MLTKITLENFKVFRHATEFPLAKINLLTGINGRGKSSLLQSLLLMRQSIEHNENTTELILNGNCVHLGTWEDVKNKDEKDEKNISFIFEFQKDNDKDQIITQYNLKASSSTKLNIHSLVIETKINDIYIGDLGQRNIGKRIELLTWLLDKDYDEISDKDWKNLFIDNLFLNKENNDGTGNHLPELLAYTVNFSQIHYIAADRIGARDFYEKDLNLNYNFITIEKTGKNVLDVISCYKIWVVHKSLYLGDENRIPTQIGKWLGHILDATVAIDLDDKQKFVNSFTYTINDKENLLPSNVGFGYSYILPIITAGLIAREGEILIVENPEAHLHPKAQSRLTEFLVKVAATGVQVFVESHSEHILRGLQIATITNETQTKVLDNKDVSILYFHNPTETNNAYFTHIPILENGAIENWEEGFFDQADKDYKILFGF